MYFNFDWLSKLAIVGLIAIPIALIGLVWLLYWCVMHLRVVIK